MKTSSSKRLDKIVIVMPTYNESKNIGRMIDELVGKYFPAITAAEMHLLVVDDNSPDGTAKIVLEKAKKYKKVHLLTGKKEGLGMAYVRGMKYAMDKLSADATLEMDSDFQHDPKHVIQMVQAYVDGADYVIGSRYIPGGTIPAGWALHRKAVSFFGNLFARIVLFMPQLHDMTTGFRLTRVKGVLDKIDLDHLMELKRFAFKVDLFYQSVKLSKKTVEVPIHFGERTEETSKFSLTEMVATYMVVLRLRYNASQKFLKFAVVGLTGFIVNSVFLVVFPSLGMTEILAWVLSTELAIISNFTLNNLWTFKSEQIEGVNRLVKKFLQFNFTSSGAIIIQSVLGTVAVSIFGEGHRVIYLFVIVIFVVMPFNYFMYNHFIWRKK